MHTRSQLLCAAIAYCVSAISADISTPNCSSFASSSVLSTYNATLLNATYYPTGAKNVSGALNKVSFCEVISSVSYGDNDTLEFTLWLPDTEYKSRFMAVGNGGEAGVIDPSEMMVHLNSGLGFAVATGDAGHRASDNDAGTGPVTGAPGVYQPFLHDEDQLQAWHHNAISLLTPATKALIKEFYGSEVGHSYYFGCSTGGGQGFALAEFYPNLFDGVIAGCPANGFTHLAMAFLWNQQQTKANETFLSETLLDFMQEKVLEACDTIDGVNDNLIENPLACPFDISSLACTDATPANTTCLTPSQLSAAKAIYQGPVRSDFPHTSIFPGLSLGSEAGWYVTQVQGGGSNAFSWPLLQQLVFNNLSYDAATFNWASDVDLFDEKAGPYINSIKNDLSAFRKSGAKMIVYAGWADPNIAPMWAMQHIQAITQDTLGEGTTIAENDFIKLVMVPGGGHCGASVAKYPYIPANYDTPAALVEWVEKGQEPTNGIRSWGPTNGDDRTRKLCTWPLVASLNEGGDADNWESYSCV